MKRLIVSLAAVGLIATPALATSTAPSAPHAKVMKSAKANKLAGAKVTKAAAKTTKKSN